MMVDDGSYYFYLLFQFSSPTMISQSTPNTRLQDDVGYKSLHGVHCMIRYDIIKYMQLADIIACDQSISVYM